LKGVHPQLEKMNFTESPSVTLHQDLVEYESKFITHRYKFAVLYVKDGQTDENEIFANPKGSEEFDEFLQVMGKKVLLRGFKGYKGGLDTKHDSSGTHSYYTTFKSTEIMFHVQTLMPNNEKDAQRLERKRHLGNDVVVVVFKEGNSPFDPAILQSQFNHVFVVVKPEKDKSGKTHYRIANASKSAVNTFEPFISNPVFPKSEKFREFLLTKLINGERTANLSTHFMRREIRTRRNLLREFVSTYNEAPKEKSFWLFRKGSAAHISKRQPKLKELEADRNLKKLQAVAEMCNNGMSLYRVSEEEDDDVNIDALLNIFQQIHVATGQENVDTSRTVHKISVRRFGRRGVCEILKPSSLSELLTEGGRALSITAVKARSSATEDEINISKLVDNEVVFLTTEDEEEYLFSLNSPTRMGQSVNNM